LKQAECMHKPITKSPGLSHIVTPKGTGGTSRKGGNRCLHSSRTLLTGLLNCVLSMIDRCRNLRSASVWFGLVVGLSVAACAQSSSPSTAVQSDPLVLSPSGPVSVAAGSTVQFVANAIGAAGAPIQWRIEGETCTKAGCGTISEDGLYTAPEAVLQSLAVRVTAQRLRPPFDSVSEQVAVVESIASKRRTGCLSPQPGFCTLPWKARQIVLPYVW
jgi:hypothetical protein